MNKYHICPAAVLVFAEARQIRPDRKWSGLWEQDAGTSQHCGSLLCSRGEHLSVTVVSYGGIFHCHMISDHPPLFSSVCSPIALVTDACRRLVDAGQTCVGWEWAGLAAASKDWPLWVSDRHVFSIAFLPFSNQQCLYLCSEELCESVCAGAGSHERAEPGGGSRDLQRRTPAAAHALLHLHTRHR